MVGNRVYLFCWRYQLWGWVRGPQLNTWIKSLNVCLRGENSAVDYVECRVESNELEICLQRMQCMTATPSSCRHCKWNCSKCMQPINYERNGDFYSYRCVFSAIVASNKSQCCQLQMFPIMTIPLADLEIDWIKTMHFSDSIGFSQSENTFKCSKNWIKFAQRKPNDTMLIDVDFIMFMFY